MGTRVCCDVERDYHGDRAVMRRFDMRVAPLFLLVVAGLWPAGAQRPRGDSGVRQVSVAELEQALARVHGENDKQLAKDLSTMELTERLSDARRERWDAQMPGSRSRAAFEVIADASAFLALPAADLPNRPAPDLATQRRIIGLTVDYVKTLAHVLPNLYATKATVSFRNVQPEVMASAGEGMIAVWQPMRLVGRSTTTVTYRDGAEVQGSTAKSLRPDPGHPLVTRGEFGPILDLVLVEAAHGRLEWSHWEPGTPWLPGTPGLEAVFRYSVPLAQSHYQPGYCCRDGKYWEKTAAYHGEIAVDPESGVVERLTLETDLLPGSPLVWTGTMVRYGAVELGGKLYPCPLRSESISQAMPDATVSPFANTVPEDSVTSGALQTLLNDTVFENYRLFHASVRILGAGNRQ